MNDELLSYCIYDCAMDALSKLFSNGESFYYVSLISNGEGCRPFITGWSKEALNRKKSEGAEANEYYEWVKWSYADSPYVDFAGESFSRVDEILMKRPSIDNLSPSEWAKELEFRFGEMETAIRMLDDRGVFSKNQPRNEILVNVEIMPPDHSNTLRAIRLNSPDNKALIAWLAEAAE